MWVWLCVCGSILLYNQMRKQWYFEFFFYEQTLKQFTSFLKYILLLEKLNQVLFGFESCMLLVVFHAIQQAKKIILLVFFFFVFSLFFFFFGGSRKMPFQRHCHQRMYFCYMDLLELEKPQLWWKLSCKKWKEDRRFLHVLLQTLLSTTLLSDLFLTGMLIP